MYEVFEHTADLGLRITAPDLPALFSEAGTGLCALLVDDISQVQAGQTVEISLAGRETDYLLFDFLSELLYRFEMEGLLLRWFQVQLDAEGLRATCQGEPADPARHHLTHEVKAITYHGLKVAPTTEGWQAEVIVDI